MVESMRIMMEASSRDARGTGPCASPADTRTCRPFEGGLTEVAGAGYELGTVPVSEGFSREQPKLDVAKRPTRRCEGGRITIKKDIPSCQEFPTRPVFVSAQRTAVNLIPGTHHARSAAPSSMQF